MPQKRTGIRWRATTLTLCCFLLSVQGGSVDARSHRTGLGPISYGRTTPDFPITLDGGATSLAKLRGKPVVLNFWATYCEPCLAELGAFAQLHQTYGDGVAVIAISNEEHALTKTVLESRGVDAIDVSDPDRAIFFRYGVTPIPVTVVLRADGTASHVSVGELDWNELQAAVLAAAPALPSIGPARPAMSPQPATATVTP